MAKKISEEQSDFKGGTAMWHGVELRKMSREQLYAGFEELGKLYGEAVEDCIKSQMENIATTIKSVFSNKKHTESELENATWIGWVLGLLTATLLVLIASLIF